MLTAPPYVTLRIGSLALAYIGGGGVPVMNVLSVEENVVRLH